MCNDVVAGLCVPYSYTIIHCVNENILWNNDYYITSSNKLVKKNSGHNMRYKELINAKNIVSFTKLEFVIQKVLVL